MLWTRVNATNSYVLEYLTSVMQPLDRHPSLSSFAKV